MGLARPEDIECVVVVTQQFGASKICGPMANAITYRVTNFPVAEHFALRDSSRQQNVAHSLPRERQGSPSTRGYTYDRVWHEVGIGFQTYEKRIEGNILATGTYVEKPKNRPLSETGSPSTAVGQASQGSTAVQASLL